MNNNTNVNIKKLLSPHLVSVLRPARYVGGELNMIRKDSGTQNVSICLAFPDIYDIGQSYTGFYILYHILNNRPGTLCERTFAPWTDMEEVMRREGIPLWSLESFLPVSSFDAVGFTLQYELHYPTVLNMLDLAGIPIHSRDRSDGDPLVLGGGPCCTNPEPVADFFDAILLGDGEDAFPEMLDVIESSKNNGLSREETLQKLATVEGVYVPSLYTAMYDDGQFTGIEAEAGAPMPVRARYVGELKPEHYPEKPLVPNTQVVHDRLAVEISRGCSRGCRFCNAGMAYRPPRHKSIDNLVHEITTGIKHTGYEEVSLISLSTTDYPDLESLIGRLGCELGQKGVSISLSSMRADNFSVRMAAAVAGGRKSSLTFAVEAATQRLRNVINKNLTEEQLFETLETALAGGWNGFKLYFMIGLPTETAEDVAEIAELLNRVDRLLKKHHGRRVNVTVSAFSPKPATPFQWAGHDSVATLREKVSSIKKLMRSRTIKINDPDPVVSKLECLLGRGGRNMGAVIEAAWRDGCRLDGWSEHFSADRWRTVFADRGIDMEAGEPERKPGTPLPWSHLDFGISEKYLLRERDRAISGESTPNCADQCQQCGEFAPFCAAMKRKAPHKTSAMPEPAGKETIASSSAQFGRKRKTVASGMINPFAADVQFRIRFAKREPLRYTSHLDILRYFERAIRRAGLPLAFSQGFHPHPKISFGPPLSLGMTSTAEYADIVLQKPYPDIEQILGSELKPGLELLGIRPIHTKPTSLNAAIVEARYEVPYPTGDDIERRISSILDQPEIIVERMGKKGVKQVNIRPGILDITTGANGSGVTVTLSAEPGSAVKPTEAFRLLFDEDIPDGVVRTEQYARINGRRISPLEVLR